MNFRFTNTGKHALMAVPAWLIALLFTLLGKSQGLGFYPTFAAAIIAIGVEQLQYQRSGKSFLRWAKASLPDSIHDVLVFVIAFALLYHGSLKIILGTWYV